MNASRKTDRCCGGLVRTFVREQIAHSLRGCHPIVGALGSILSVAHTLVAHAAAPAAPLPVPCVSTCGQNPAATPFVQYGTAGATSTGKTLTVNQASNAAILNWQQFNIDSGYSVNFKQPSATSSTLNRIWSADPSKISGNLTANGQLYLINQNGIIFGQGAQVNTGGLTASTLNIADSLYTQGLLSQNNTTSAGAITQPAIFDSGGAAAGAVTVENGATLSSSSGGRIILIGSSVSNAGKIATTDGQAILAAGNSVYLAASTDPALRGLLVEVNAAQLPAGSAVTNTGEITAARGNVTLAGLVVNQSGRITATTSVNDNGSISLVAGDTSSTDDPSFYGHVSGSVGFGTMLPNKGGTLTLASGSVTEVVADSTDTGTLNGTQTLIPSAVNLVGKSITLQANATVRAPAGEVNVTAAADPFGKVHNAIAKSAASDGSDILLEAGSVIDTSGLTNVSVSATRNLVDVRLSTNDLQDDPLLRDGFLHGQTVTVDLSVGTKLFDTTPYKNNIGRGINELLTQGGSINLDSNGTVVARSGSTLNVSGGSVAYQGGFGKSTTKLLGADGKVYDIGSAPNNIQYVGFANQYSYTDPTWGTTTGATSQSYHAAYIQGADAGGISILSPQLYFRGTALGETTQGIYQRSLSNLPKGGSLVIGDSTQNPAAVNIDYRAPSLVLSDSAADTLAADFDPATQNLSATDAATSIFSTAMLRDGGFSRLGFYSNGGISLTAGSTLSANNGGAITMFGQNVALGGNIRAASGSLQVNTTANIGTAQPDALTDIVIGSGARIDLSGSWINDSPLIQTTPGTAALTYSGGTVSLQSRGSLILKGGSLIDVSGGGWVNSSNALTAGSAGSITLAANSGAPVAPYTEGVQLGGSLRGASLTAGGGGTLAIQTASVTVGPQSRGGSGELLLSPDFFTQGGFRSYAITGKNGVVIGTPAAPVTITPLQQNLVFTASMLQQRTGTLLSSFTALQTLPSWQRSAASVSFSANATDTSNQTEIGSVILGQGSSIVTDPGATVSLAASGLSGNLRVLGQIIVPAGTINLTLGNPGGATQPSDPGYIEGQQLLLGPTALLSATAYAQTNTANTRGYRQGSELAGGAISLSAYKGYIVTNPGSVIDVSGGQTTIDVVSPTGVTASTVAGNAGSISIAAREGMVLAGQLEGHAAAVPGAAGGTLSIGLDPLNYNYQTTLTYNSGGIVNPYPVTPRVLTLSDQPATQLSPLLQSGQAQVSTASIAAGGFDNVTLKSVDVLAMDADVHLSAKGNLVLDAPVFQGSDGFATHLAAAHVSLGNYFNVQGATQETLGSAAAGTGSFEANAQLIDIRGASVFSGFGTVNLVSSGDVRLSFAQQVSSGSLTGSLLLGGDLNIAAAQIYPTTATAFTIRSPGTVTILPATSAATVPLSAGGTLEIDAQNIVQQGVLRAPAGQISLNALGSVSLEAGSLTSVNTEGMIIPEGFTQNGSQWLYTTADIQGGTHILSAPTAKQININAPDVAIGANAKVDLSGGGDIYAYEFVAGQGGSKDVLSASSGTYTYAIVPGLGSQFAPIDAQYNLGSPRVTGSQTITLADVPGIPDGTYALLPARYALLPGAYAVQVTKSNSDLAAGSAIKQPDGSFVTAARIGQSGTDIIDSRTSTVLLSSDSVVRSRSQYNDSYANSFFTSAALAADTTAPAISADAGELTLAATHSLALASSIDFATGTFQSGKDSNGKPIMAQGLGGTVAIVAPDIAVVDQLSSTAGAGELQLATADLNRLGASMLILGATRTIESTGEVLSVGAQTVELRNAAANSLSAPEIVLAATDSVLLDAGSGVKASGNAPAASQTITVNGDGALFLASSGRSISVSRTNTSAQPVGTLTIGSGASMSATGSLFLDGAGDTIVASDVHIDTAALSVSSSRVSLGDAPAGVGGVDLTTQLLAGLSGLQELNISSASSIDLYGTVNVGAADAAGQPQLATLRLSGAALNGYGTGDKTFTAGAITFDNEAQRSTSVLSAPDGSGALNFNAVASKTSGSGVITLGAGNKSITGFSAVNLSAGGDILGDGVGLLQVTHSGDLSLLGARLTTTAGANQQILNDVGRVTLSSPANAAASQEAALGGRLSITATAIEQNGTIDLPAGILTLHSTGTGGDVTLSSGAVINAAGGARTFSDTYAVTNAGEVQLISDQGNVTVANGATVDLSGAIAADKKTAGNAGSLSISAIHGSFVDDGTLKASAAADQLQGNFTLDVQSVADFSALNSQLSRAGFKGAVDIRARSGDVAIAAGDHVVASSFVLAADAGAISVLGSINTSGGTSLSGDGGQIGLWAQNNLTIGSGAVLNTNAGAAGAGGMDSRGGAITISSANGVVDFQQSSTLSLLGTHADSGGTLTIRAPRTSDTDLALTELGATINSNKPIIIEGVRSYSATSLGGVDGGTNYAVDTSGVLYSDTQTFVAAAPAIATRLGIDSSRVQVRAGLDIHSDTDLTLTENWDLADAWKTNGAPVNLTLRAAGNLILNGSLSDGFTTTDVTTDASKWTFAAGDSATLRLTAGADLSAANPLSVVGTNAPAVTQGGGDFILAAGKLVRTGTGDINVAAAHDVRLESQSSVIYTAGVPSILSADQAALFPLPKPSGAGKKARFSYPTDGGSVTITAGNDVTAAPTTQLITDWMWRRGATNADGTIKDGQNTTWWINFQNFQQGVGALGGGNVTVKAGGDINNLSAVIPTTGRLIGAAGSTPDANNLVVTGGGLLVVSAGRDIASGIFENDRGNAQITAGDAFTSGRTVQNTNPGANSTLADTPVYPIFALGNGVFDVAARSGITLAAAVNSTVLPEVTANVTQYPTIASGGSKTASYYYTVAPTTTLNLTSAAGDVQFAADNAAGTSATSALANVAPTGTYSVGSYDYGNLNVYPPTVNIAAMSGDIGLAASSNISLLPSAIGNLNLLAYGNVNAQLSVVQVFEADPSLLPSVLLPSATLNSPQQGGGGNLDSIPLPAQPLYQNATDPIRIIAQTGNINAEGATLTFPKSAEFIAAGDITGFTYVGKNLKPSDVTLFQAGGSILLDTASDPVTGALQYNQQGITLGGPGFLELVAGGAVNLGDSVGVVTSANLGDVRLPTAGASLVVAAGLGSDSSGQLRQPASQAFIDAYLAPQKDGSPSAYTQELIDYMSTLDPSAYSGLDYSQATAAFESLLPRQQLPLLSRVLSDELSATGLAHTKQGTDYQRGYQAINTLFPSKDANGTALTYSGDINLSFSQLKTEQGGSIDLLAPGGSVIVGLANPPSTLYAIKSLGGVSAAANLGILVLGRGAVHGLADQSFIVNQSRILTLEGGDIILWASNGNIDAGKGAKTASGAPPPVIQTDARGNVFVNPINSVSGSGIGQLLVKAGIVPGLVNLIAPKGDVNAGDAGIRVAGNLNIAAVAVLGASNITVGGTATGVPVSEAGALSGALSGANSLGDAGKSTVDQLAQNLGAAANFQQLTDSLQPAFIVVRMFCLGVDCEAR